MKFMVNILELLFRLEYSGWECGNECCPYCYQREKNGHKDHCNLAKAILENGGETKLAPKE